MTPAAIIKKAKSEGVTLELSPTGNIKALGEQSAVYRWLPMIREHKPEIVQALKAANDAAPVRIAGNDLKAIRAWLDRIGETDPAIIGETLDKCASDPEALAYFVGLASEGLQASEPNATSCDTCQGFRRPGMSEGYCVRREDLPLAYGANHPLRILPEDNGATCHAWRMRK